MSLSPLLLRAHAHLQAQPPALAALPSSIDNNDTANTAAGYVLFFSLSDGRQRAHIVRASGVTWQAAWQEGSRRCQSEARRHKLDVRWLRIDWPTHITPTTWGDFTKQLAATRRNYFRYGLALDAQLRHAFLEGELNANAMLYPGSEHSQARINPKNFTVHAQRRYGQKLHLPFEHHQPQHPVWLFAHQGLFISDDATATSLPGSPQRPEPSLHPISAPALLSERLSQPWNAPQTLDSGHRQLGRLQPEQVMPLINSSARFLAAQVKKDGMFIYGHFPCFGRLIPTYNSLRHASTIYSMLEAWELMQDDKALLAAIQRALNYLDTQLIIRYPQPDGSTLAFNVDHVSHEVKLGANAVSLLAMVKYDELTGDTRYRPLMEQLALGICHMQQGELDGNGQPTGQHPGKFVHVLNSTDLSLKAPFRIVYYDGEAAFGLMRLYGLTKDERWLHTVERAFDYFIAANHWHHHDHWLSYCANELTLYKPEEKYFRFGVQNVADFLDFILQRETTYPTLLELSMAFAAMLRRIQNDHPEMQHVLDGLDIDKFHHALHHRAHYLLNGFFWPELAMYYAKPHTIVGSFFIRHHSFRVRIDDVEHYLSGFVAYWKMLEREKSEGQTANPPHPAPATSAAPAVLPQAAIAATETAQATQVASKNTHIVWGGDVNLGRRQHYRAHELGFEQVLQLPALAEADLGIINLECVVATTGEQGTPKGEGGPYYYRARPEMLDILTHAGVDMVATANNHSGDYGPEAVLEQAKWLDAVGIAHAGTGQNFQAALQPAFAHAGDMKVALFSLDATQRRFAATDDKPGSAYLPLDKPTQWRETLAPLIEQARKQADIVLVAVHWGENLAAAPTPAETAVGYAIIDAGADAVLGASAHILQGIEIYRGRPILYDAGDLLFDSVRKNLVASGLFALTLCPDGISAVRFIPVGVGFGRSQQLQGQSARELSQQYNTKLCNPLGTNLLLDADGSAFIQLSPVPRHSKPASSTAMAITHASKPKTIHDTEQFKIYQHNLIDHAKAQRWIVETIPEDASMEQPVQFGSLRLVGIKIWPTEFKDRRMLWVESFWQCDAEVQENIRLNIHAVPTQTSTMPAWGQGMDHDPCDWMLPTTQWKPGYIYRDFYGLRPPYLKDWVNGKLQLEVGRSSNNEKIKSEKLPIYVTLAAPGKDGTPVYRSEFPEIIYQNKPGQTWNAEQLAAITGGEWIVKPPKDWHVSSVAAASTHIKYLAQPCLYVAHTHMDRHRHEQFGDVQKVLANNWDAHLKLPRIYQQVAGAIVSKSVSGLPKNFPILQVDDPFKAILEIGAANRKRLTCPIIAITGSAGKTSTLGMFNTVFNTILPTYTTYDNYNSRGGILVNLASVSPSTKLVVLETAISAINSPGHIHIKMVEPDIAIITNIGVSHLKPGQTTLDTARRKSNIFKGMKPGSVAVICRDSEHFDYMAKRAAENSLKLITYGEHPNSDILLDKYDLENKLVHVKSEKSSFSYYLSLPGKHMAINSLACLAVAKIMGIKFDALKQGFTSTKAVEGRGTVYDLNIHNKNIRVYDESYNANPLSMKAAISMFGSLQTAKHERKIMVLGDMLELGDNALTYHKELVGEVLEIKPSMVFLIGSLMPVVSDLIKEDKIPCVVCENIESIKNHLLNSFQEGDHILLKASNSIGLSKVVTQLVSLSNSPRSGGLIS